MSGERLPQYANDFRKDDVLQLLLALQSKVNRELHVATLCVIDAKINDHTFRACAFPKQQDRDAATFNVICIRAKDAQMISNALSAEDGPHKPICIAIMTDLDSQANYEHILSKHAYEAVDSSSQLHSLNNAVLAYIGDCTDGTAIDDYLPEEQ